MLLFLLDTFIAITVTRLVMQSCSCFLYILYTSDKYELSNQKKTFGKDVESTFKHTLHVGRKSFCKLDGSCWALSFGAYR